MLLSPICGLGGGDGPGRGASTDPGGSSSYSVVLEMTVQVCVVSSLCWNKDYQYMVKSYI